ncbi:hypothetical protein DRN97_09485 [Methanosarcinales archaeon]|nr:MAG: hypothetical protein DRN97_09485 [Methanosarcinales archaeon]
MLPVPLTPDGEALIRPDDPAIVQGPGQPIEVLQPLEPPPAELDHHLVEGPGPEVQEVDGLPWGLEVDAADPQLGVASQESLDLLGGEVLGAGDRGGGEPHEDFLGYPVT